MNSHVSQHDTVPSDHLHNCKDQSLGVLISPVWAFCSLALFCLGFFFSVWQKKSEGSSSVLKIKEETFFKKFLFGFFIIYLVIAVRSLECWNSRTRE